MGDFQSSYSSTSEALGKFPDHSDSRFDEAVEEAFLDANDQASITVPPMLRRVFILLILRCVCVFRFLRKNIAC